MAWAPVHTFNINCGTAGAYVDVTSSVYWDQGGVVRAWGRQSAFNDFSGGTFAFTLDNRDGRFTPDSTNVGATPLSEGQTVTWQTDTRLISGKIAVGGGLQLIFPDPGQSNSARIRVTVGDMVVTASRRTFKQGLASSLVYAASPYLFWALNDPSSSQSGAETSGRNGPALFPTAATSPFSYGATGIDAVGETQLTINPFSYSGLIQANNPSPAIQYGSGLGSWGVWMTFDSAGANTSGGLAVQYQGANLNDMSIFANGTGAVYLLYSITPLPLMQLTAGIPHYFSVTVRSSFSIPSTTMLADGYVDGVFVGTSSYSYIGSPPTNAEKQPRSITLEADGGSPAIHFSHLSHTPAIVHEERAGVSTEAVRLQTLAATTPDIALATLPAALSKAPIGPQNLAGASLLDAYNDVIRTEQGQIFAVTTGTGTAPVQSIGFRERTRPTSVTATWVAGNDIRPDIQLTRDLSNTVSEVDVTGSGVSAIVTGADLMAKIGSASTSFNVLNTRYADVYTAGSDRLNRGRKVGLDVASLRVDGISGTNADRSSSLLTLALGDRHRISGLPSTQLGYSSWDGFLLGVNESWTPTTAEFVMYLEPTIASTAVYDTGTSEGNRYMANGDLTLSSSITNSATTMSVATTGARLSTTAPAYLMQIDNEIVNVTAVTSATPQVVTMVRGVSGTTAAAHTAGALIEMATAARYAF